MRIALCLLLVSAVTGCAIRHARPPAGAAPTPNGSTPERIEVVASLIRLSPGSTPLFGLEVGPGEATLVFESARREAFLRAVNEGGLGIDRVDSTEFRALPGRWTGSDFGLAHHLDTDGLVEWDADELVTSPAHREFSVGVRADRKGDRLMLEVKGVWTDFEVTGAPGRGDVVRFASSGIVPLVGGSLLIVSPERVCNVFRRARYVLVVSPRLRRATEDS